MIPLLVTLTVLEILLLVGALAFYLVRIVGSLRRTSGYLAKVSFGVRAIETQCIPVGPSVVRINEQLGAVAADLAELAERAGAQAGKRP